MVVIDDAVPHRRSQTIPERIALVERDVDTHTGQLTIMSHSLSDHTRDIAEIQAWRKGLIDEIRGALRIPKVILASTPFAFLALAIWTQLQH